MAAGPQNSSLNAAIPALANMVLPRRQHTNPVLIDGDTSVLLSQFPVYNAGGLSLQEDSIQDLVHKHPSCLPIAEIDRQFVDPIAICRELRTPAGPIDNFLITATGLPVLVECKLWKNPEGRREVVGQILDYAKHLSRWSASDIEREVNTRVPGHTNALVDIVKAKHPGLDEIEFNDALTQNLRRGRFLLLIVGDGIRENVESLVEFLQRHAGLHFSFGLVELPFFQLPDGKQIVVPRVVAKTSVITRTVVEVPSGFALVPEADEEIENELFADRKEFWERFLKFVDLDDREQPLPKASKQGYVSFMLPAPAGSSWITVYRDRGSSTVGVFLSSHKNSVGEQAMLRAAENWSELAPQLGGTATLTAHDGRPRLIDRRPINSATPDKEDEALKWLAERVNAWINTLRPFVRSAAVDAADAQ